jgi:hypothetical protein
VVVVVVVVQQQHNDKTLHKCVYQQNMTHPRVLLLHVFLAAERVYEAVA